MAGRKLDWEKAKQRTQAAEQSDTYAERPKRKDPVAGAATALRYHLTDCGVSFALDCAARGEQVVYASDWSPGSANEDRLRAAGVELHTGLRRGRG